jgi:hypothetical protein
MAREFSPTVAMEIGPVGHSIHVMKFAAGKFGSPARPPVSQPADLRDKGLHSGDGRVDRCSTIGIAGRRNEGVGAAADSPHLEVVGWRDVIPVNVRVPTLLRRNRVRGGLGARRGGEQGDSCKASDWHCRSEAHAINVQRANARRWPLEFIGAVPSYAGFRDIDRDISLTSSRARSSPAVARRAAPPAAERLRSVRLAGSAAAARSRSER